MEKNDKTKVMKNSLEELGGLVAAFKFSYICDRTYRRSEAFMEKNDKTKVMKNSLEELGGLVLAFKFSYICDRTYRRSRREGFASGADLIRNRGSRKKVPCVRSILPALRMLRNDTQGSHGGGGERPAIIRGTKLG